MGASQHPDAIALVAQDRSPLTYSCLWAQITELLKVISQREGVTLFMTLLAAFQILLYRYTGQEDIVVGAPIAGRIRTETEKLIGVFINTLVLRTYLDGKLSFRELWFFRI
jgi:non-ribosomal peptide synthetase component F